MKSLSLIIAVLSGALLFSSCEKTVHIDLNKSAQKVVIEAQLLEGDAPFTATIKKTTDYYGKKAQVPINDAVVWLYEAGGDSLQVPSLGNGEYSAHLNAVPGRTYKLKVMAEGKEYTSQVRMLEAVKVDSVVFENENRDGKGNSYKVSFAYTDPQPEQNYYRIMVMVNDTMQNSPMDLTLFNDQLTNGRQVIQPLRGKYEKGDDVHVVLISMDQAVYEYFISLDDVLINQNGPSPANPVSNISGGALGYFGAFATSGGSISIQ